MSVGATLAQYHRIVEGIESPPGEAQLRYAPQSMQALIETILERDFMGDLTATLASYDARIAALRATLPNGVYESLPHVVIHGDVHRDNLLFAGDSVVALLDYDQIAWDTPLADLADALVAFASVDKSDTVMWGVFDGPLDEERADLLILAYTRSRTLTPAEVGMLPILLEVHWLKAELGRVVSTPEGAPDYHMAVLEQGLELSQWIQERRESLTKRWIDIATGAEERVTASAA
jgi:homoserine kinase type II